MNGAALESRLVASLPELRGRLKAEAPLKDLTWFRAGGPAEVLYSPADEADLAYFLKTAPSDIPVTVIGLGSNLLVRDGGWRGTVVMTHSAKRRPAMDAGLVYAEAGVASPKVARFAALHDLEGAEFLAGVPGCVGGALAMNAGCYGGETWDLVERVLTIDRTGALHSRSKDDFDIAYRQCTPKASGDEWFAAAWFRLEPGDGETSRGVMKELLARRIATQPLSLPNAGSVFRNPPRDHAARLIESCGLKGFERGGARVSEKHANFIVNPGGVARAADIEWLIQHIQRIVYQMKGVVLQTEVRIVGEPA